MLMKLCNFEVTYVDVIHRSKERRQLYFVAVTSWTLYQFQWRKSGFSLNLYHQEFVLEKIVQAICETLPHEISPLYGRSLHTCA